MWTECSHSSPSRIDGVAVLQLRAGGAQRLDLGALEHDPALQALDEVVAVAGVAVGRHVARSDLALALSLCHRLQLSLARRARDRRGRGIASTRSTPHLAARLAEADASRRCARRCRIVPCSLSSHQSRPLAPLRSPRRIVRLARCGSPRQSRRGRAAAASTRTGSMPSNGSSPAAAAAPGRRRRTRPPRSAPPPRRRRPARGRPRPQQPLEQRSSGRRRRRRARSWHRLALAFGGPRAELGELRRPRRAARRSPSVDSSARWQTRSG